MKKNSNIIFYDFEDEDIKKIIKENLPDIDEIIERINLCLVENYKINKQVSIYFAGVLTIKDLNLRYRNIDKATDVLSFPYDDITDYLGEIVICFDEIMKRADLEEDTIENTLVYMIFHSFLHLLGFSHDSEDDYKIMEEKTEELLGRYNSI